MPYADPRERDEPTCGCASRTCAPHRCWPSRAMSVAVLGAIAYAVCMHSFWMADRAAWKTEQAQVLPALATLEETIATAQTIVQEATAIAQQKLEASLAATDEKVAATLAGATEIIWAYETPQIKKDLTLLKRLNALEASSR